MPSHNARTTSSWLALAATLAMGPLGGCTHRSHDSAVGVDEDRWAPERTVAQASARLPDQSRWEANEEFVRTLDLTQEGTSLMMSTGGTSVYAQVHRGGRPIGAVLPANSATIVSGEIMAFHLSRLFGASELTQPGFYYHLTGPSLARFYEIVPKQPYTEKKFAAKEANRQAVLERIQKNPNGIPTVYKFWDEKPSDYDALVSPSANTLNKTHVLPGGTAPVATLLSCNGPQPSASAIVTMNGASTNEAKAIRQLSTIFLIDALVVQWDRFSGGNLSTAKGGGEVRFVAFDNGGTWGRTEIFTAKYLGLVSRFDRAVAERILELDAFLNGGARHPFMGLRNETEFVQAMGVESVAPNMRRFKQALAMVAAHVRANTNCYFQ